MRQRCLFPILIAIAFVIGGCSQPATESPAEETPSPTVSISPSETDITNYAQAVLAIEQVRQSAYSQIQQAIADEPVPNLSCDRPESLKALSGDARDIAVDYCNEAKAIIENNNLSVTEFNAITAQMQTNPELKQQVDAEVVRLQQQSGT